MKALKFKKQLFECIGSFKRLKSDEPIMIIGDSQFKSIVLQIYFGNFYNDFTFSNMADIYYVLHFEQLPGEHDVFCQELQKISSSPEDVIRVLQQQIIELV